MSGAPSVSVVVVSRDRPRELARALTGLRQLDYDPFEIVVVADSAALDRLGSRFDGPGIKSVPFDEANISRARNVGITHSGGEIVAFMDDDAVPEPTWLGFLTEPFRQAEVAATSGYVRGRNGISFQSKAEIADCYGWTRTLNLPSSAPAKPDWPRGFCHKLVGTNMAIRRNALTAIGGFDESFAFFLEDTDLSLRLNGLGHQTVVTPAAQVHHAFSASCRRAPDRTPLTLYDIGRSLAVFLRKHAPQDEIQSTLASHHKAQFHRMVRHMMRGNCEPRDIKRVLATFEEGVRDGQTSDYHLYAKFESTPPFRAAPASATTRPTRILSGRSWQKQRVLSDAKKLASRHTACSVYLFSPTALFHRVQFQEDGYWLQTGGLFGRSLRNDPLVSWWTFSARLDREVARVEQERGIK